MVPSFLSSKSKDPKDKSGLTDPVDKEGNPRKYISFLIPLFKNDRVKKTDMLLAAGVNLTEIEAKGYFSGFFRLMTKTKILKYDPHFRLWERGENWSTYIGWVITELCKVNALSNKRVSRMFKTFTENSTNFIMDLDEEHCEKGQND